MPEEKPTGWVNANDKNIPQIITEKGDSATIDFRKIPEGASLKLAEAIVTSDKAPFAGSKESFTNLLIFEYCEKGNTTGYLQCHAKTSVTAIGKDGTSKELKLADNYKELTEALNASAVQIPKDLKNDKNPLLPQDAPSKTPDKAGGEKDPSQKKTPIRE